MFSNHRNAVVMRRGEKQVLRWWKGLAEFALPWLDLGVFAFRKQLKELLDQSSRTDGYDVYVAQELAQVC